MENCCLITLTEKFRSGDMSAFPLIYAEFEGLIYHYTAKCSAEDTYQELTVFLVELLYKAKLSQFVKNSDNSFKRYIAVCLGNKYIALSKEDILRKSRNISFEDRTPSVDGFFEKQLLKDAMAKLTVKQQKVICYKYIYDYSDTEIAYRLNISRQAVNRIKNRAFESLREYLK